MSLMEEILNTIARNVDVSGARSNVGMFINPAAKTFDHDALKTAEALRRQGQLDRDIHYDTGVHWSPDGTPLQEIDDSQAKFVIPYEQLVKNKTIEGRLQYLFEHPELYEAYPGLKDVRVKFKNNPNSEPPTGGANPEYGYIEANASNEEDLMGILIHELRHIVQEMGGEAQGTVVKGPTTTDWIDYVNELGEWYARKTADRRTLDAGERRSSFPFDPVRQSDYGTSEKVRPYAQIEHMEHRRPAEGNHIYEEILPISPRMTNVGQVTDVDPYKKSPNQKLWEQNMEDQGQYAIEAQRLQDKAETLKKIINWVIYGAATGGSLNLAGELSSLYNRAKDNEISETISQ